MTDSSAYKAPLVYSWRAAILEQLTSNTSQLTLVTDPDNLLSEETLACMLRKQGLSLLSWDNSMQSRYAYEVARCAHDGERINLVVILRPQGLSSLPYDLLQAGRQLTFNLGQLFPALSTPIIAALDRSLLDTLFEAQRQQPIERLGADATSDFTLQHVFGVPAYMTDTVGLLRTLLHIHYRKRPLTPALAKRLIERLKGHFSHWPLADIVPDSQAFFAFLQERWPLFLSTHDDSSTPPLLRYAGPMQLPFAHQDIKVYIDTLFLEGQLTPVCATATDSWARCGIVSNDAQRISRLFAHLEGSLPPVNARYSDWIAFAMTWARLTSQVYTHPDAKHERRLIDLRRTLHATFAHWLYGHYAALANLPAANCAMLHHLPHQLARENSHRVALLVIDGLALDQWVSIRDLILADDVCLAHESATFAWIPTLTAVSRQSLLSGEPPFYFPTAIHSTKREKQRWQQFWQNHGLSEAQIAYRHDPGKANAIEGLTDHTKAIGLIITTVDKIMHGMQLGASGMHNQVRQWCSNGFLSTLISHLLEAGFTVWLTSDHGNIDCQGIGCPAEGSIADARFKRARIYPTAALRAQVATAFPTAHLWQPIGLPSRYFPLLASSDEAFAAPGQHIVGHGGITMEEVIVPLVAFSKKKPRCT